MIARIDVFSTIRPHEYILHAYMVRLGGLVVPSNVTESWFLGYEYHVCREFEFICNIEHKQKQKLLPRTPTRKVGRRNSMGVDEGRRA